MSNMDEFNKAAALVLNTLYEEFPKRIRMYLPDLFETEDEDKLECYSGTVLFLIQEGYLYCKLEMSEVQFEYITLTNKGLAILNSVPDTLKEKTTLGQRLGKAVKSGSQQIISTVVNQIITAAINQQIPHS